MIYADDSNGRILVTISLNTGEFIKDIINGKYRGLSPEVKIRRFICSICNKEFEDCDHNIGQMYGKQMCYSICKDIEFLGASIVSSPADSRCRVTDLLIIEIKTSGKQYTWYGFPLDKENDRFDSIQKAMEGNLLPKEAAFRFSKYFSINLTGKTIYP